METGKAVPITPTLLREEAKKVRKCMREPGIAPWALLWMARIIEVDAINLKLDCPKCGRECDPCNGAHAAYNIESGTVLRIVIVDFMCKDCPHVWAHWQNVPEEKEKPTNGEPTK